jgi:hypothetical protein
MNSSVGANYIDSNAFEADFLSIEQPINEKILHQKFLFL